MDITGFEHIVLDPQGPEPFDLQANIPDLASEHWQQLTRRELIERWAVDINYAYDAYRAAQN